MQQFRAASRQIRQRLNWGNFWYVVDQVRVKFVAVQRDDVIEPHP
jgi:hypothetical protein